MTRILPKIIFKPIKAMNLFIKERKMKQQLVIIIKMNR